MGGGRLGVVMENNTEKTNAYEGSGKEHDYVS
jgi:hypothetical protein